MSSAEDSDSYMEMMMEDEKLLVKFNLENNEFSFDNKSESSMDEDTIDHEDLITGTNTVSNENFTIAKHELYYDEDESRNYDDMTTDYFNNSPGSSDFINDSKKKVYQNDGKSLNNSKIKIDLSSSEEEEEEDGDDDDNHEEETMATFYTSDGQQLALYAVENSEDIFAVSLYDESAPPSDFQFLAKSDVEKLVNEGAIQTVKKPSQLKKKQFKVAATPPIPKKIIDSSHQHQQKQQQQLKPPIVTYTYSNNKKYNAPTRVNPATITYKNVNKIIKKQMVASILPIVKEPPQSSVPVSNNRDYPKGSTVQSILQGNDEGDLTIDDIAHLFSDNNTVPSVPKTNGINVIKSNNILPVRAPDKPPPTPRRIPQILSNTASKYSNNSYSSPAPKEHIPDLPELHFFDKEEISPGQDDTHSTGLNSPKGSNDDSAGHSSKIKRPRKQQLVFVDRADSEIIIQTTSAADQDAEKEGGAKKRGRKKRKIEDKTRKPRILKKNPSKKHTNLGKKYAKKRQHRIEVIDIVDVDNDNDGVGRKKKKKIDEITIDDGKEKGSSDKENDVIEVGDTDNDDADNNNEDDDGDDEDEEIEVNYADNVQRDPDPDVIKQKTPSFKCDDCDKVFRLKRALISHSEICQKSSTNYSEKSAERINRKSSLRSSRSNTSSEKTIDKSSSDKKEYCCKICGDKFDVVVALARHTRLTHLTKKKVHSTSSTQDPEDSPTPPTTSPIKNRELKQLVKTNTKLVKNTRRKIQTSEKLKSQKQRQVSPHATSSWKSKKMDCGDCGRWFPSVTLLSAHSLQHATKKSAVSAQYRHKKIHNNKKQLQKTLRHTRQTASKITPIKKPGRPKKN